MDPNLVWAARFQVDIPFCLGIGAVEERAQAPAGATIGGSGVDFSQDGVWDGGDGRADVDGGSDGDGRGVAVRDSGDGAVAFFGAEAGGVG